MPPKYPIPLRIREYKLTDKGVEVAVLMSNFNESKFDLSELATIDSGLVQEFYGETLLRTSIIRRIKVSKVTKSDNQWSGNGLCCVMCPHNIIVCE